MKIESICVLGGGGFVGHHLVSLLAARGHKVRVPARRREAVKDLAVLPTVEVVESDIHDSAQLKRLFEGMDAVINLVGILHESRPGRTDLPQARRGSFHHIHVELPRKVAQACAETGVQRLLHMSALGANPTSRSAYQRSKGVGEAIVLEAQMRHREDGDWYLNGPKFIHGHGLNVTVFRPSVIFGPGDSFLSLFAGLLKLAPVVPLAGANARFQPVFVGDVARAFADALRQPETFGKSYDLCGPKVYTLAGLVRLTARTLDMKRHVLPLGKTASYWFARLMELKPGRKLMTRDNHYAMLTDNVCSAGCTIRFGTPTELESVIGYLREADPRRRYMAFRARAGR